MVIKSAGFVFRQRSLNKLTEQHCTLMGGGGGKTTGVKERGVGETEGKEKGVGETRAGKQPE